MLLCGGWELVITRRPARMSKFEMFWVFFVDSKNATAQSLGLSLYIPQ